MIVNGWNNSLTFQKHVQWQKLNLTNFNLNSRRANFNILPALNIMLIYRNFYFFMTEVPIA